MGIGSFKDQTDKLREQAENKLGDTGQASTGHPRPDENIQGAADRAQDNVDHTTRQTQDPSTQDNDS